MNLVVNAQDAMPEGGILRIETSTETLGVSDTEVDDNMRSGAHLVLTVSDTGCGMDPEIVDRIFEPFFTTKEVGKGTGLGLATVYGIVKQAGGHIAVESTPGTGTTFRIRFPAESTPAVAIQPPHREGETECGRGETVLVCEDEPPLRSILTRVLEAHG